jgi:hypothetical protein
VEEQSRELELLRRERHRAQEVEAENARMQQEIIRMQSYIGE